MNVKHAFSLPTPPDMEATLRTARRAEDLGYESLWVAETSGPDAFVTAGAVARATRDIRIGTAVVPVYTRSPAVLAAAAGTVAQLAPARFVLGLGASSRTIVEEWSGVPFTKPLTRVRETAAVIRDMLAGKRSNYEGRTLHTQGYRLASLPPQPIPLYLAALMPPMLELAGEYADGVILNMFPVEALPRMLEHIERGAKRAGKKLAEMEIVCRFMVAMTEDHAFAHSLIRPFFGPYFATSVYNRFVSWCGFGEEASMIREGWAEKDRAKVAAGVSDELIERIAIIGNAESCRSRIADYVAAGVTTPMINPLIPTTEAVEEALQAFKPHDS